MKQQFRYPVLDLARGISLLSMIGYHAAYDLVCLYGLPASWFFRMPGRVWQQSICWTFIFLSGMCFNLGRRPLKRGLLLTFCGLLITLSTWIVMPDNMVVMGILNFFGLATLLMIPVERVCKRLPASIGFLVSILCFLVTKNLPDGFLGFFGRILYRLPASLYQSKAGMVFGFPYPGFYSSDYFPLFPWFFLFLSGFFAWKLIQAWTESPSKQFPLHSSAPGRLRLLLPLEKVGKYTLPIYMLHQPILMALFELCDLIGFL